MSHDFTTTSGLHQQADEITALLNDARSYVASDDDLGDLGNLGAGTVLIAISHSGKTAEVAGAAREAQKRGVPAAHTAICETAIVIVRPPSLPPASCSLAVAYWALWSQQRC